MRHCWLLRKKASGISLALVVVLDLLTGCTVGSQKSIVSFDLPPELACLGFLRRTIVTMDSLRRSSLKR